MKQAILSIVFIAVVVGGGYFVYQFFIGSPSVVEDGVTNIIEQEKLTEYRKIKLLKPDLGIFTDSFFRLLFSPTQLFGAGTVTPVPVKPGRPNPFIPF